MREGIDRRAERMSVVIRKMELDVDDAETVAAIGGAAGSDWRRKIKY